MATFSTTGSMGNRFLGKRWVIVCRWDGGFFIAWRLSRAAGGSREAAGGSCEEGAAEGQACPHWLW